MIPYGRQIISDADVEAVVAVLRSDFLTQGPQVPAFEQALAAFCETPHAVAVNSATSALHIACLALGVGPGDTVWTCTNTFLASANCALYCGADVEFLDIDPRTLNVSVPELAAKLEAASAAGRLPKVLIPVHFAGLPCDMAEIAGLARRHGVAVVEDASHAVGARYGDGSPVGSGHHSDITVFSFHPVKIMTTAEGGAALTRDGALARKLALLRSHGMSREPEEMRGAPDGPWYYQQLALGYNYRMTELQGALGRSQLPRVPAWVDARHALADRYDQELAGLPLLLPWRGSPARSALHLYVVQLDEERTRVSRRHAFEALRAGGIGVNVHYIPVHTQPFFRERRAQSLPAAERYYARCITLPLHAGLTVEDQDTVIARLREVLQ
ncbi:UDP-4-amino-4,6-dideoxy-N-acetyl-beta-L-altrosamine transaminase [Caenimonas sedimenti]|uniref:UDP-4-amino-4, 6-dideoxy-N-acetyl-beta-L-altrosamine transaminase n=2 Tax=Caenimonas sedimenti TaxID=2596921 RepID=A0A562ZKX7_9BURK|nr:UDP-4-amino-4,6-dideoxy-N-acetyl-beta-L-altrosamine transaminase [Caenimonas sedimenti]TWO68996.1 UDP-4-amino-4,6-dideoxy-N-acetyl-beta-L-altrosamine transaminase [Caenimonas sedimenti]